MAAARHEKQKGLDVLVRASRRLCDARPDVMVLIGGRDGNESGNIHRLIDQLRLEDNVRLIGQRDDVAELMCAADVWCVPSRWEGLGESSSRRWRSAYRPLHPQCPPLLNWLDHHRCSNWSDRMTTPPLLLGSASSWTIRPALKAEVSSARPGSWTSSRAPQLPLEWSSSTNGRSTSPVSTS